tara:strand:- start:428 stop:1582 length:1155 start_codon:yes stop_codon:yes gene_type:complete
MPSQKKNEKYTRIICTEASTKSGKSFGALVWIAEQAFGAKSANQTFYWVAPVYQQSKIMFRRIKSYLPPNVIERTNETDLTVTLKNTATIQFRSASDPNALYGDDCWGVVIDEASRMSEDAYIAIRSTLTATKGQMRIIGNVRGRKNWFYILCRKAEMGEDAEYGYNRISAWDAIDGNVLDRSEIISAQEALPESVFKELYEATASDDEGNPFGHDMIQQCIAPKSTNVPVVWGWDLAKSRDWTVGIALDSEGTVCEYHRFQRPWKDTKERITNLVKGDPALIDSTGVGDAITEDLQRVLPRAEGFKFTQGSKQQLMEGLSFALSQQKVKFPQGHIVKELEAFEYEYTKTGVRYTAPQGMTDDAVCALALAVKLGGNAPGWGVW